MEKINWCKNQKKGIKLIKPNSDLAKEYIQTSEETFEILKIIKNKSNMWLASAKYYCEYFMAYALLMKIGIKSEIHDCTIEICKKLGKKGFLPEKLGEILENDKKLRIDNQHYLKNKKVIVNFKELSEFLITLKNKIKTITEEEMLSIRKTMK